MSKGLSPERVLVIGVRRPRTKLWEMQVSLEELVRLVETAGGEVVRRVFQNIPAINPATFLGKGKIEEIKDFIVKEGVELAILDDDLSPVQNRNLEKIWGIRVHDRTAVILDIFAMRAKTKEGKLQVELAELEYMAPRLVGRGVLLSQQAGRIGTRGPGETKLEYDRRHLQERIIHLKRCLNEVRVQRRLHRQKREGVPIPLVALVGYTNAGKSTLMNALTGAGVLVEEKLFATLDPTVRRLKLPSGREALLADTVGFIRKLPHQLVAAFRATFEELGQADLLLEVLDVSDPEVKRHLEVIHRVLNEFDLGQKPHLLVLNKSDCLEIYCDRSGGILVSALKGEGLRELLRQVDEKLQQGLKNMRLKIPLGRGEILSEIYRVGQVHRLQYQSRHIRVECAVPEKHYGKYKEYTLKPSKE